MQAKISQEISFRSISDLVPYAQNARGHSDTQIAKIAASIREFGFIVPVIVDDSGHVICGHGRILAAKQAGLERVPTVNVSNLSELQKRAFMLADNRLAQDGKWDIEKLGAEITSLQGDGFDISLTGFVPEQIDYILSTFTTSLPKDFGFTTSSAGQEEKEFFDVSFSFPAEHKDSLKKFLTQEVKRQIVNEIIARARCKDDDRL